MSPVQALGDGSGSIALHASVWTGSAPIVALGTMSGLSSFEFIGGNPGTAASPFGLLSSTKAIISYQGAAAYRGGKLGVGTLAPGNLATITGTNLDYTAPVGGNATMRVTTGSGSILDPGLSFGNNTTEGWIQAVQPGTAFLPLRLNGGGGGALVGKPPSGLTDTTGLSYVPAYSGTPTAAPVAFVGYAPIAVDMTNGKICTYVASAWKCASLQ